MSDLRPFFCADTGRLTPNERAIHDRYQSDDPHGDYYDPTPPTDHAAAPTSEREA